MANYEDKLDILVEKFGDLAVSIRGIEVRLDNVEDSLKNQEVTLKELSCNSSLARIRFAEIDAENKVRGSLWSKLQPFFLVLFTMILTGAATTALHVFG